jgi:protoporphyrinogen oxidase
LFESLRCIYSLLIAKFLVFEKGGKTSTFEVWVTKRFGRRLFEIFFKTYSEKLWGISCKTLDADFAAQRIKQLSLFEAIKSAFMPSIGSKHKTLVDEFAYSHGGTGLVYDRMVDKIKEMGGKVNYNSPVKTIETKQDDNDKAIVKFESAQEKHFDFIISTMPITNLVMGMNAPAHIIEHAKKLKYRNTILVYLRIKGESPFPDQWIYVHSNHLKTGRITNFSNWVPHINRGKKDAIICLEYWCYDEDDIWNDKHEKLIALATKEIYSTGLIKTKSIIDGKVIRIPKCYPVYQTGYKEHLKPIEEYLSEQNGLIVIGRGGAFKYNNQDHSIMMGILAAENICDDKKHNLWDFNTDYEYQETSKISALGLTKISA